MLCSKLLIFAHFFTLELEVNGCVSGVELLGEANLF
jgi:hypothetical protein